MKQPPTVPSESNRIALIDLDPWLEPYADRLRARLDQYRHTLQEVCQAGDSLLEFARGHHYYGFNRGKEDSQPGVWFREWAPAAVAVSLTGDFNGWDRQSHQLHRDSFGVWSRFFPDDEYAGRLTHGSRVKLHVHSAVGQMDRIPAYARRVKLEDATNHFVAQVWNPPEPHVWRHAAPALNGNLRVYEAHVGMATEEQRVGTYTEFRDRILPRIVAARYNAVQLMAIQEHPYYGSFGYQVSNYFAPSSRFGTPEELKSLIDTAHGLGLVVLLDLVHSHAVKNTYEGLNLLDGTQYQYFHDGPKGQHPAWDSLLFDYGKTEVLRFLLSNVRYWLEEFRFDGFRFDGVTSMMYVDHGLGPPFASYDEYFPPRADPDAVAYLQLANELAHAVRPGAITIAEDVSGMVGIARPVAESGIGFDYRLAMGIPDYWIKLLKHERDEAWPMETIFHTLNNRRHGEKHVAYAESHDQALVGDKTIAFWLMDKDMYFYMSKTTKSDVIERGIALHKMIRLLTFALGGEAYLNFMGNEFGHPEWIDFPREGNNYSYKYARRQWSLVDDKLLRYTDLAEFDRAMQELDIRHDLLAQPRAELLHVHEDFKLLAFRRGPLVFAFNFHPTASRTDYALGVPDPHDYQVVLNTDDLWFGGHANTRTGAVYPCQPIPWDHRPQRLQIYIPARTAQVLLPT